MIYRESRVNRAARERRQKKAVGGREDSTRCREMTGRTILLWLSFVYLLFPENAVWAFQSHPAPEGLYVHQLAHLIFIVAMSILVYWLQSNRFVEQRGWRLIQVACILFILWNIVAFAGHWVEEQIPKESVFGEPDWRQRIDLRSTPLAPVYYLLKLDHLVSVPAMVFLVLGLRSLYKQVLSRAGASDG